MVQEHEEVETALSRALLRLLKYFNLLEVNLGLSLSFLMNESDPKDTYSSIAKMSLDRKISKLMELVEAEPRIDTSGIDLHEWTQRAQRARYVRNAFVHGSWDVLPYRAEGPIQLSLPPWIDEDRSEYSNHGLSVRDVEEVADEVGGVYGQFMHFRQKLEI